MSRIIKRGEHYFWPRIERFSECVDSFCREGPNAGKPGPCPDPEKAKKRAEIKAGKINVKKVKEKVEKEKPEEKKPEESQVKQPFAGATVEDETRWHGSKITVQPDPILAKRSGEKEQIGTLTRVLNGGDLVEFKPAGFDTTFRVPASRVKVDELKDSGTKNKPEEAKQKPEQEKNPLAANPDDARKAAMKDPLGGLAVAKIDELTKAAKEGTISSAKVFEEIKKISNRLSGESLDHIASTYGVKDPLPELKNPVLKSHRIADLIAEKYKPEKEKWKPDNPPTIPFNPDSLIRQSAKSVWHQFPGLLHETGQFTDGKILLDAPKWQNRKITQATIEANPPDRMRLDRFTKSAAQLRSDAKRDASSASASVVSRRTSDAGMPQYSLSDGQRSEAIDGRYHETVMKLYPNAKPRLNKKNGGPLSYFDGNRQVAILMPLVDQSPPIKHSESPSRRFSLQRRLFAKVD